MSLDVVVQAFENERRRRARWCGGQRAPAPAAAPNEPHDGFLYVEDDLGSADIHGVPDEGGSLVGLMFNHVGGTVELVTAGEALLDVVERPERRPPDI